MISLRLGLLTLINNNNNKIQQLQSISEEHKADHDQKIYSKAKAAKHDLISLMIVVAGESLAELLCGQYATFSSNRITKFPKFNFFLHAISSRHVKANIEQTNRRKVKINLLY